MARHTLDPTELAVETFDSGFVPVVVTTGPATDLDCPTATGCTCIDACQSAVQPVCPAPPTLRCGEA